MNPLFLCITAIFLGLRHGFDFDHLAAIADLIGGNLRPLDDKLAQCPSRIYSYRLAILYFIGHALVLVILSTAAIFFRFVLPSWIDPVMEKVVGSSLIILSLWMLYCIMGRTSTQGNIRLQSRWMLVLSIFKITRQKLASFFYGKHTTHVHEPLQRCDWKCALSLGVLHGISAETGTQVLLFTSLTGTTDLSISIVMLTSFLTGMLVASLIVATIVTEGYQRTLSNNNAFKLLGFVAAAFTMFIGVVILSSKSNALPSVDKFFKPSKLG